MVYYSLKADSEIKAVGKGAVLRLAARAEGEKERQFLERPDQ